MPWLSVFLPPPTHIYIHSRFLARCSSPFPIQQGDPVCPRSLFLPPWPAVRGILRIPRLASPPREISFFLSLLFLALPFIRILVSIGRQTVFRQTDFAFGRALQGSVGGRMAAERRRRGGGFLTPVLRPIVAAGYRPLLIILREFRHDDPPRTGWQKTPRQDSFPPSR